MSLTDRMNHPDRRQTELTPIVERRGGEVRRVPAWVQRMEKNAKDLTGQVAA